MEDEKKLEIFRSAPVPKAVIATPVFLSFLSLGTLFGIGGTSVISRALGEGDQIKAKRSCSFPCDRSCVICQNN